MAEKELFMYTTELKKVSDDITEEEEERNDNNVEQEM